MKQPCWKSQPYQNFSCLEAQNLLINAVRKIEISKSISNTRGISAISVHRAGAFHLGSVLEWGLAESVISELELLLTLRCDLAQH